MIALQSADPQPANSTEAPDTKAHFSHGIWNSGQPAHTDSTNHRKYYWYRSLQTCKKKKKKNQKKNKKKNQSFSTLKSSGVHVAIFSACWTVRRDFLSEFFIAPILHEKSVSLILGVITFHKIADRETKFLLGVAVISRVSFRFEILNWLWMDMGILSFKILNTSIYVW